MKKTIFSFFLLLPLMVMANNGENAKQHARLFLEKQLHRPVSTKQMKEVTLALSEKGSELKAFNVEKGGFALVVENEENPIVIGYSTRGELSESSMPAPMREWLKDYKKAAAKGISVTGKSYKPVAQLLNTTWGQREPYNFLCPTYDENRTVAGCTAVALAQVLYYYRSENTSNVIEEYVNAATNTEISVDYSKGGYDWDNMLTSYNDDNLTALDPNYTEQQAQAVARLMFEAGVACHSNYGFDSNYTTTEFSTSGKVPYVALQKNYNFNCDYYYRPYVPTEFWMDAIQQSLLNGSPVIYVGGTHCYVVDGIDSEGLCHVNWGWEGSDDGYYDIAFSKPSSYGGEDNGFTALQRMIVNIKPRQRDEEYVEKIFQSGATWFNETDGGANLATGATPITSNYYGEAGGYTSNNFGWAIVKENKVIAHSEPYWSSGWKETNFINDMQTLNTSKRLPDLINNNVRSLDGVYELRIIYRSRSNDDAPIKIVDCPESLRTRLEIKNGTWTMLTGYEKNFDPAYLYDMQPASDVYNGSYFYVELDMEDGSYIVGPSKRSLPSIDFENTETGKLYSHDFGMYVHFPSSYPGLREKAVYRVKPVNADNNFTMPAGTYKMVLDKERGWTNAAGKDLYIDVEEKRDYPIIDYYTNALNNGTQLTEVKPSELKIFKDNIYDQSSVPQFFLGGTKGCYSANTVGGNVVVNIYATPDDGGEETFICSIPDVVVNANSSNNTYYTLPCNLFPLHGAYRFTFRYLTPDGERGLLNPLVEGHLIYVNTFQNSLPQLLSQSETIETDGALQAGAPVKMSLPIKNNTTDDFNGKIKATFLNLETGEFVESTSESSTIASSQVATISFTPTFTSNGVFDVYLDGIPSGSKTGTPIMNINSAARAHLKIGVGASGIGNIHSSRFGVEQKSHIYNLQGLEVPNILKRGIYIINGRKIVK